MKRNNNFVPTLSQLRDNFVTSAKSGSALIITLLVIMVISAVGIGIGRLTLSEIKQTANLENAVGAEAIAESGIEHGLLLYRFNHNAEVCEGKTTETSCDAKSKPLTIDMGSGAYYDILMYYMVPKIGNPDDINDPNNPTLTKDKTLQISGLDNLNYLIFEFRTPCTDPGWTNGYCSNISRESGIERGVEITRISLTGDKITGWEPFYKQTFENEKIIIPLIDTKIVRIKPWDTDMKYTVEAVPVSGAPNVDSGYTYIESTGYFGNTKRKLQVKIDRASGSLLGTYDFVLYSGTGEIAQ